jgi:hypothetical protein
MTAFAASSSPAAALVLVPSISQVDVAAGSRNATQCRRTDLSLGEEQVAADSVGRICFPIWGELPPSGGVRVRSRLDMAASSRSLGAAWHPAFESW